MESKGGYVWDPQKKTWVRPTEPKDREVVAGVSKPVAGAVEESKPVETVAETKVEEESVEAVVETAAEEGTVEVEAVSLDYMGALSRIIAFIIDSVVLGIVILIFGLATGNNPYVSLALLPIYFLGFWAWRGQTPGKMVMRGRVVKADGSRAGFVKYLIRAIVFVGYFATTLLAGWFAIIATIVVVFFIIGFTRNKRGPHDWIAGTCVVNTRSETLQPEVYEPSDTSEPDTDEQV